MVKESIINENIRKLLQSDNQEDIVLGFELCKSIYGDKILTDPFFLHFTVSSNYTVLYLEWDFRGHNFIDDFRLIKWKNK